MESNQLHQTQATYDAFSRWYDLLSGPFERRPAEQGLALLHVSSGEKVLEIGCGTGYGLLALADAAGPSGMVYGLDLSAGMLQVAQQRLQRRKTPIPTLLCQGDGAHLPLVAGSINVIWMSFVLELMPDERMGRLLAECARVLQPGGRIGIVSMARHDTPGIMDRLYRWGQRHWPRWIDCRPIDAAQTLAQNGFSVTQKRSLKLVGLSVDAVVAVAPDQA